jgi:prepilin-type N-terminal cleavage/methylation domain-containing protein
MRNKSKRLPSKPVCHSPFAIFRSGMTLIELLIVIVIIAILISAVLVASTSLIGKSKTRNTQAVLQIVADAAEQFKRSETEKPMFSRNAAYKRRYGLFPPDELEVFSPSGVPGALPATGSLATPTGSVIVPAPPYAQAMRFYTDGTAADALEHRDLTALIVAIECQGGEAAAILDRISDRNRSAGVLDPLTRNPAQFLNRPAGINGQPEQGWQGDDLQIRYILDDWGIPISYMSQRDFIENPTPTTPAVTPSSNHPAWNEASTELMRINNGIPLIYSLGPNGKEQTSADLVISGSGVTFMDDFEPATPGPENQPHVIDHPFNSDNVYLNEGMREKLAKGIAG